MKGFRKKTGKAVQRLTGREGGAASGPSSERLGDITYAIGLTVALILTAVLLAVFSFDRIQYPLALGWGILFGWTFLFYVSPKIIMTLFGGFVGVGIADLAKIADQIETLKPSLQRLLEALSLDVNVEIGAYALFVAVIGVFCIPVYRTEESNGKDAAL